MKIFVAMSGGVDSAVAALLLRREGHDVVGIHLRTGVKAEGAPGAAPGARPRCCGADEADDARRVAAILGIPYYVQDAEGAFARVIASFVDAYARGETPNPCVACNSEIKFGALLDRARALGGDAVATGHYARRVRHRGAWAVARAADAAKDQSYVLHGLRAADLERVRFPLGDLAKPEVRRIAAEAGLPVAMKPDSQEICFVPSGDYRDLVRRERPEAFAPGTIVDTGGTTLGAHEGVASFTVGQRKGLGIAAKEPLYVVRLEPEARRVVVGPRAELGLAACAVDRVTWTAGSAPGGPLAVDVCVRYRASPVPATVEPTGETSAHVRFAGKAWPLTPGQAAVFYEGNVVVGGGTIRSCS
ncbi:MAG TPA: tRNA 2-thiouridine(34) synthase MnmA [Candidatus Eisenbacteria bacterium]|nr:tRNA 2-thiouridine(34) synthase MnmA [Candidatus Eisenbacteria bacterium]